MAKTGCGGRRLTVKIDKTVRPRPGKRSDYGRIIHNRARPGRLTRPVGREWPMWICFETLSCQILTFWRRQDISDVNRSVSFFLARDAATKRLALFQASATKTACYARLLPSTANKKKKRQRPQSPRSPIASNVWLQRSNGAATA